MMKKIITIITHRLAEPVVRKKRQSKQVLLIQKTDDSARRITKMYLPMQYKPLMPYKRPMTKEVFCDFT